METKDTVSSCSVSKDQEFQRLQEKAQLSKEGRMKSLRTIQSQFKFLTDTLQDFGTMPIFKRTFAQDLDLLEQHLTKEIISQTDYKTILTKLRTTTFENAFNSEFKERMQKYTRFDAQSFKDAMICNMDSIGKYMLEIILHQQQTPHLLKQKKLMQTQDHSNPIPALNVDSLKVDLVVIQNTCSEKEDINSKTTSSKSVKYNSPQRRSTTKSKLTKMNFKRENQSMAAFWVVNKQFQKFIDSQFTLDYDSQMTDKYFLEYTGIEYDRRVNKRQMQTQESKVDEGKALDANLVNTESIRTDSIVQDESSRSGHDTDADDADIRPIYDEEPMVEKTSPRSDLRWKPTGRIFKSVGLRLIPTGKLFDSCTSKVDSEPPHGSNVDIPNIHECEQSLDLSAVCTKRFKPRTTMSTEVHQAAEIVTPSNELDLLFSPMFNELLNGTSPVVSKSSAVTAADAPDKH
ncbi:hypothetical protein Tco_0559277 [Tanacetum coccineum]